MPRNVVVMSCSEYYDLMCVESDEVATEKINFHLEGEESKWNVRKWKVFINVSYGSERAK